MQKWEYIIIEAEIIREPYICITKNNGIEVFKQRFILDKLYSPEYKSKQSSEKWANNYLLFTINVINNYGNEGWDVCGFALQNTTYSWTLKRLIIKKANE